MSQINQAGGQEITNFYLQTQLNTRVRTRVCILLGGRGEGVTTAFPQHNPNLAKLHRIIPIQHIADILETIR